MIDISRLINNPEFRRPVMRHGIKLRGGDFIKTRGLRSYWDDEYSELKIYLRTKITEKNKRLKLYHLSRDLQENGLQKPIIVHEGKVIMGMNLVNLTKQSLNRIPMRRLPRGIAYEDIVRLLVLENMPDGDPISQKLNIPEVIKLYLNETVCYEENNGKLARAARKERIRLTEKIASDWGIKPFLVERGFRKIIRW